MIMIFLVDLKINTVKKKENKLSILKKYQRYLVNISYQMMEAGYLKSRK